MLSDHPKIATRKDLREELENPLLRSDLKNNSLKRNTSNARRSLQNLEIMGSSEFDELADAAMREDSKTVFDSLLSHFPDIYEDLFTQFSPWTAQRGDVVYIISKDLYVVYIRMWMRTFDSCLLYVSSGQVEVGSVYVDENGSLVELK